RLASGGENSAFRELPVHGSFEPFPRARLRAKLLASQNVGWPEKTRDIYRFRCSFSYNRLGFASRLWNTLSKLSWLSRRVEWDILDFPGERLADALVAKHPDFATWSDELLELWETTDNLRDCMGGFLDLMGGERPPPAAEFVTAYKKCLAGMVNNKNQLITPSTFMLDQGGVGVFTRRDVENGGVNRASGLIGFEFTPLSRPFREANAELAEKFAGHYRRYREEMADPLFKAINGCDTLIILVDIPGILSGGVGRYNDTNHLIESLAGIITPSNWFFTKVDKIALVASKSDMIHARDQDSLKELIDDMLRVTKNRQPGIRRYESFIASAWVSAESIDLEDNGRALRGIPARDNEVRTFRVPELKPDWPIDWLPEEPRYSYPRLSPPRLANRFVAP
ncbi:MAG: YcjX family protein, partial [Planctomycetes bacterium]|nr:YcjX family protein [Planctomycetota bacterium]